MAERSSQSLWGYQALVSLPTVAADPFRELVRRALLAVGIVLLNTLIVWLDHESYADNVNGDGVSFIDALYYATVTVTTTGYGDITPVSDHARLLNALLVTPLRIAFLILLVGTTLEVLANEGRRAMIDTRCRKKMRNHTVVLGYGTMGRSALNTLLRNGGLPTIDIMTDPDTFALLVTSQAVWKEAGWGIIVFLAALAAIDPTLYEAAAVDGASRLRRTWHITLPGIRGVIVLMLVLRLGNALTVGFEQMLIQRKAVGFQASEVLDTFSYYYGVVTSDFGYGAAAGLFKGVLSMILIIGANKLAHAFGEDGLYRR